MKLDLQMLMESAIIFCPILKNEIEQPRNRLSGILEECFLCIGNSKHVLNRFTNVYMICDIYS